MKKNYKWMRIGLFLVQVSLVIQFIVGMYLNFYIQLPSSHPGIHGSYMPSIPWSIAGNAGSALAIHVTNWILLTVEAVTLTIYAILSRRKLFIIGNVLGLLFILVAGSSGLAFLNQGGKDKESFMMALGFILAFITYGITFYKTKES